MILPASQICELRKGELGEVVVDDPPAVGAEFWVRTGVRMPPDCRARVVDVWPLNEGGHAVLLEAVAESFRLPERMPPQRQALKLTRTQRMRLFAGECPHIHGQGPCPVKPGETVRLSARVTLVVLRVDAQTRGRWRLMYELHDTRDPVRLVRRTPPTHREGGEYEHPTAAAIRDAGEQSGYTSSPRAAVSDAGEAPPRGWMASRAKAISEFDHQRRLAAHAEKMRERSKDRRKKAA